MVGIIVVGSEEIVGDRVGFIVGLIVGMDLLDLVESVLLDLASALLDLDAAVMICNSDLELFALELLAIGKVGSGVTGTAVMVGERVGSGVVGAGETVGANVG